MGSPPGPLFANAFVSDFEEKHIGKLREMGLNIWLRYVDDVYATVKSKSVEEEILLYLNSQHPNIRFTMELENGDSMPFLDVRVIRRVNKYETTVYHKKTFTGVYLNWTSLTSRKYKVGLIKCLLDRIWKICSTENDRAAEIEQLRRILKQNEFPQTVVESEISRYMARKTSENVSEPSAEQVKPEKRFIVLPFVHRNAEDFGIRLKKLVKVNYPQVDFNVAFKAPKTIGELFPFKDNVKNTEDKSLVVYKIKCKECGAEYIGKTERMLCHRIKEHQKNTSSVCYQHVDKNPGHQMDYENIEIIDKASTDFKLRMKELLHILKRKPELNKQLNSQSNYDIKTLIIAAYPQFRKNDGKHSEVDRP